MTAAGESAPATTAHYRGLMLAVHLLFGLSGMAATASGALLPLLIRQWGLSDAQAGSLIAAEYGGSALAAIFVAALIMRGGFRGVLIASAASIAAGLLLLAFASWPLALLAVLAAGIGIGLVIPAANLLVAQVSQRSGVMLNLLNCAWVAGAIAGPLILKSFHQNPRVYLLSLIAVTAAIGLSLLAFRFPAQHRHAATSSAERIGAGGAEVALFAALFFLYVGTEAAVAFWVGEFTKRS